MAGIAIFASGTGSNAAKIIDHFRNDPGIHVNLVVSNKPGAGVLDKAKKNSIPTLVIDKPFFYQSNELLEELKLLGTDLIVLAGFLWLVPEYLINAYPKKIVNIHPALLPKFGGKGMYGANVHKAVKEAAESESGITIHYVNHNYDEGQVIFQTTCSLDPKDQAEDIARKVLELEHQYYPRVIESLLKDESY